MIVVLQDIRDENLRLLRYVGLTAIYRQVRYILVAACSWKQDDMHETK